MTDKQEWVQVQAEQVGITEQGGIGRAAVEGEVRSVAYEAVLTGEEEDASSKVNEELQAAPRGEEKKPLIQQSLFDDPEKE